YRTPFRSLCTGAYFGGAERWNERIGEVRAAGGLRALVPDTADRWFAAGFLDEDIAAGPIVLEQMAQTDPEGYIDCCGALAAYDIRDRIATIDVPLLLLAGAQDPGNTPDSMRELHEQIEGSSFAVIPDAAHLPMVEHPELVADRLEAFLTQQLSCPASRPAAPSPHLSRPHPQEFLHAPPLRAHHPAQPHGQEPHLAAAHVPVLVLRRRRRAHGLAPRAPGSTRAGRVRARHRGGLRCDPRGSDLPE